MKGLPQLADAAALDTSGLSACAATHKHDQLRLVIFGGNIDARTNLLRMFSGTHKERVLESSQVRLARHLHGNAPVDFSLFLESLASDTTQGMTVATVRRDLLDEETPFVSGSPANDSGVGHITEVAIHLLDARDGLSAQARQHAWLIARLGCAQVLVVVDHMDSAGYDEQTFRQLATDYRAFAESAGGMISQCVPVSCARGENMTARSEHMRWFPGDSLLAHIKSAAAQPLRASPLRLPVQLVNRSDAGPARIIGVVTSGKVMPGDRVRIQPSGSESTIERIIGEHGELPAAHAGQAVTLTLTDAVNAAGGDIISAAQAPAAVADQFGTTLIWLDASPMLPGRNYLMKIGSQVATASVTDIKHQVDVVNLQPTAAKRLEAGAIAECNITVGRPIAFDPFAENRDTGCYVLLDAESRAVVGGGLLNFALRRSQNIHMQHVDVNKQARSAIKRQTPCVLWFTGLSGAGKSTIANAVERKLHDLGYHTYLLDGDNVRHGLNRDLGFTAADRVENIRRIAEVAKLMVDAGLIVATAFISPFRAERQMARALLEEHEFIEVFVDTPLEVAEQRDVKGLYKKARRGELKNFTGIDSPYETPEYPEFRMDTTLLSAQDAADEVVGFLHRNGYIL